MKRPTRNIKNYLDRLGDIPLALIFGGFFISDLYEGCKRIVWDILGVKYRKVSTGPLDLVTYERDN